MKNEAVPNHMRGPMRVAAKAGFISKRIWNDYFAIGNRVWRFRRWRELVGTGYFTPVPDYGFVESALTLSVAGQKAAVKLGMSPVYSPPSKNLWHDEELIRLALFLERQGWVSNWKTEQEIRLSGEGATFFQNQVRAIKIPDLIVEWDTSPKKILWAIELERTPKVFHRYDEMVGAYKGISRFESVLVIVANDFIETNIKKAQARRGYPQAQRPMFFASMNQVIENPMSCEFRQGANRMALGNFAKALTGKSALEPSLLAKIAGNTTGNNVARSVEAA